MYNRIFFIIFFILVILADVHDVSREIHEAGKYS